MSNPGLDRESSWCEDLPTLFVDQDLDNTQE